MDITGDSKGFLGKAKALRSLMQFFENAPFDACGFYQEKIVNEVINGQYVNVISGNLKRSVEVAETSRFSAAVVSDLSIAPYSPDVRRRTKQRFGKDFYEIATSTWSSEIEKHLKREWDRAMTAIRQGRKYTYHNPFPA